MRAPLAVPLLLVVVAGAAARRQNNCETRALSRGVAPAGRKNDVALLAEGSAASEITNGAGRDANFSSLSRRILSLQPDVYGTILSKDGGGGGAALALRLGGRLKVFRDRTPETETFWRAFDRTDEGWGRPFKDCDFFSDVWFYVRVSRRSGFKFGLFVAVDLDRCDESIAEIFNGTHQCGDTQLCVSEYRGERDKGGGYRCVCRHGFFYPGANATWNGLSGQDLEAGRIDATGCQPCPKTCLNSCGPGGVCAVRRDVYLKTIVLCIQLFSMGIVIVLSLAVFKQRKTKAIATGMWTILETILLGIFILYNTVVIRIFKPSIIQCLLEPWIREVGFIICYGAIILKLYRHLIEFRTRKAHRWVVKDTDLLKYLLIMILSVLAYMAAYASIILNFLQENYSLLYSGRTIDGEQFEACKYLWWDYVTETGELAILIFGIHLAYASRNARTQFQERSFLCAAISLELAVSAIFYASRVLILHELHPDLVLIVYCVRTQVSQTVSLLLIFLPKFWYQQKQVRSLGQEYSCRYPLDAFKENVAHRNLSGNNSDVEIGEISLAEMSPDDIRAELKRLYLQLETFKAKTICRDNPHISKRRGGRKAQHRRFSLQSLHARHRDKDKRRETETEITEAEPSRTPEDSICSNEGPSAIYADLPSTNQTTQ